MSSRANKSLRRSASVRFAVELEDEVECRTADEDDDVVLDDDDVAALEEDDDKIDKIITSISN